MLFSVQTGIDLLIPDVGEDVKMQSQRGDFYRRVVAEGKFPLPPADDDAAADDGAKEVVLHDKDDGPYHAHWISGALRQSFDTGAPLEAAFGADTV